MDCIKVVTKLLALTVIGTAFKETKKACKKEDLEKALKTLKARIRILEKELLNS